jgi:septal ring-binding cell division protein DamX
MKKFFAFVLAFLIVVGIYLLMKKQANPSNEVPTSVKTILGLEKPQQNIANEKNPGVLPTVEENKNPEQDDEMVIKEPTPSTGSAEVV